MDYILGILTGIGLALFAGYYLNERERKRRREEFKECQKVYWSAYWNGVFGTSYASLEQRPQDAIARDDFEEAARIRDLINKK